MANWDILIIDPIILVAGIVALSVMFFLEKIKGKTLIFYLETILIWIANTVLTKFMAKNISTSIGLEVNDITFTIMVVMCCALVAIIFKPLATYLTGRGKSRRIWMWVAYGTSLVTLVMFFFNKNFDNTIIYFISIILVGFSMSSSSLYYLFSNEQHYYRVNSLGVGFVVAICIAFSTFCGSFLTGIQNEVGNDNSYFGIITLCLVFVIIAAGLGFIKKENHTLVKAFSDDVLADLQKTKKSTLIWAAFAIFIVSLSEQLTHGIFDQMTIAFLMKENNIANANIIAALNSADTYIYGFIAIFGYFTYQFMKNVGIKFYNLACGFLAVAFVAIEAFARSGILIICLNILSTFCFTQIMYSLFATAIFQNYRRQGVPVTGYFAASIQAGVFVDGLIENLVIKNKVSIFNKYNTINSIIENYDANNYQSDFDGFNTCLTAVCCVAICLTLIAVVILYFIANNLFAEYSDLKQALIFQKANYRKSISNRAKTPVDFGK
jgi:MFS family permease